MHQAGRGNLNVELTACPRVISRGPRSPPFPSAARAAPRPEHRQCVCTRLGSHAAVMSVRLPAQQCGCAVGCSRPSAPRARCALPPPPPVAGAASTTAGSVLGVAVRRLTRVWSLSGCRRYRAGLFAQFSGLRAAPGACACRPVPAVAVQVATRLCRPCAVADWTVGRATLWAKEAHSPTPPHAECLTPRRACFTDVVAACTTRARCGVESRSRSLAASC